VSILSKEATTTETRLEPELVITQEPFWDLLRRGHANPRIQEFVNTCLWPIAKHLEFRRAGLEAERLKRTGFADEATLYRDEASLSQADEREEGYTYSKRTAIDRTRSAIERTRNAHLQLRDKNEELLYLHTWFQQNVRRIDYDNEFLRTLMQNGSALEGGNVPLAPFIFSTLSDIGNWFDVQHGSKPSFDNQSPLTDFYINLKFGDPDKARSIPAYLAHKYYPEQLEAAYMREKRGPIEEWYRDAVRRSEEYKLPLYESIEEKLQEELLYYRQSEVLIHIGKAAIKGRGYYNNREDRHIEGSKYWLPDIPACVFSDKEREILINQCRTLIEADMQAGLTVKTFFQIIDDIVEFCYLLRKPENHIKIASGQYVEKQVHVRQVHDMADEMAQELTNLPRFTAYAKIIEEKDGEQKVKTGVSA
jgi:hypothetical protein